MPRKKSASVKDSASVLDYRHDDATRKNIPPAGLAAQGKVREVPKMPFAYDPHLPPVLRSDATGAADRLPELLQAAQTRPLTAEETRLIADALRQREPWLEWAGKREKKGFEVDPVALHIHERVAAQAILKVAARESVQRSLFADPQQSYREAVQFYQYDVDWSNRMIVGDSLQVMASLAHREGLAGKVQMIYVDPPYGIKFASNFQPEIGRRDVKDKESDLTREPEMVKAYRDTWTLGVHSYLAYLRDRLYLCKELLADTGSIFVQISDENLHRVRCVMDEVFGCDNFVAVITFTKTSGATSQLLAGTCDYLLWYAKSKDKIKYRQVMARRGKEDLLSAHYQGTELPSGERRPARKEELGLPGSLPQGLRLFALSGTSSQTRGKNEPEPFAYRGILFRPETTRSWSTTVKGLERLAAAERLHIMGNTLRYIRYFDDSPVYPIGNLWTDTAGIQSRTDPKVYVVQTSTTIVERCLLMTTAPGDLVLDPTCGGGTTAYVAEQWGRRWVTIDTSRVAIALARQRLLTATFPMFKILSANNANLHESKFSEDSREFADRNPAQGFVYKTVPHITLKSIAQNVALDAIFVKHQPILDEKCAALNAALKTVTPELRKRLSAKLMEKEKREGKKSITDADRRRWILPSTNPRESPRMKKDIGEDSRRFADETVVGWQHWEVPFDADEEWTPELRAALAEYRTTWRAKMDEVNACIEANAEQEELVDQPQTVRGVVRVSGPFTVEAVMPAEESLDGDSPIGGASEELESFESANLRESTRMDIGEDSRQFADRESTNAEAYLDKMLRLLRADGVRFPNNKVMKFTRLEPCGGEYLHAEGEWVSESDSIHESSRINANEMSEDSQGFADEEVRRVAVSFGPQFGPVTAFQVENALPLASRRGFNDLVFAGFSFDGAAQAIIQDDPNPRVRCHLAFIRPDVNMSGLLKETPNSQIFTVFGSPRTELKTTEDGQFVIEMQGVDIYNPVDNTILPTNADKVAAWFLDTDYDGRTFCITQAFFPDKSAWDKLARALKGVIDEERFAALSGTVSLPFPAGEQMRAAVKVIDPRGNEVMRVHRLEA